MENLYLQPTGSSNSSYCGPFAVQNYHVLLSGEALSRSETARITKACKCSEVCGTKPANIPLNNRVYNAKEIRRLVFECKTPIVLLYGMPIGNRTFPHYAVVEATKDGVRVYNAMTGKGVKHDYEHAHYTDDEFEHFCMQRSKDELGNWLPQAFYNCDCDE